VARGLARERFAWRTETYEFVSDPIAIDLLFGSSRERSLIESGPPSGWASDLFEGEWRRKETAFARRREPYVLYRQRPCPPTPGSSSTAPLPIRSGSASTTSPRCRTRSPTSRRTTRDARARAST